MCTTQRNGVAFGIASGHDRTIRHSATIEQTRGTHFVTR